MRMVQFMLTPFGDRWRILEDGHPLGRFDDRASARRAISAMALASLASGRQVEVLEVDRRGEIQPLDIATPGSECAA